MNIARTFNDGWLSPVGEYIPCDGISHMGMAYRILKNNNHHNPMLELFNKRWFRVAESGGDLYAENNCSIELTARQKKTLIDLAIEHYFERVFLDTHTRRLIWSEDQKL